MLEELNKTLPKTPSQDSVSDPRNEEDYDTWEYGTEPIPFDHTWDEKEQSLEAYREAAKSDDLLFGDYDAFESYNIPKNAEEQSP